MINLGFLEMNLSISTSYRCVDAVNQCLDTVYLYREHCHLFYLAYLTSHFSQLGFLYLFRFLPFYLEETNIKIWLIILLIFWYLLYLYVILIAWKRIGWIFTLTKEFYRPLFENHLGSYKLTVPTERSEHYYQDII